MSSETLSSSKEKDLISARTGYFDHVFAVFKARQHPIVLVEEAAMRWMGLRVINDEV